MRIRSCCTFTIAAVTLGAVVPPASSDPHGYNTYGYPGLIDMPSAISRPDAELALTASHFRNQTRTTLTFQVTPRLSGSFRYANLYDINFGDVENPVEFRFDRSLSLHYRIADETARRPAIAVGLNDFLGTGLYSSEYLVATKTFGDRLRATAGIGWGRLGGVNGFDNPLGFISEDFEDREDPDSGQGGELSTVQFFTGDAALFGGIEYRVTDDLWAMAEYSSDAYPNEDVTAFDRESPFNFGLSYALRDGVQVSGHYLYGSELGAMVTLALNPKEPPSGPGREAGPPPVLPEAAQDLGWDTPEGRLRATTLDALRDEGIVLHAFRLEGRTARVEIENETYRLQPQAIGRTARVLTRTLPARYTEFVIVPVESGLRGTAARIARADMEELEFAYGNAWTSYARAGFDGNPAPLGPVALRYPAFTADIGPYLSPSFFDPDAPVRADLGLSVEAAYEPRPGLILTGEVRQKLFGNLDESTRESTSGLPRVRSEFNIYEREGETALTNLTAAQYVRLAPRVAGRVTVGYLETMFGGVSAELLWMPEDSPLAYGVEINHVRQRDFDQGFGFRDYEVTTGHASLYWDMGNGFHSQVDAGRYLAGDWGATFALDREFENGWRVGAFATLTDVPFEEFGEGSFDKGLRLTVPIGWLTGEATREDYTTTIRPVTRDGGARLRVEGRLYDTLRDTTEEEYRDGWGRFWR